MNEFTYNINSALIAGILFVSMLAATELGYRLGFRRKTAAKSGAREHINAIQGSILGILALLLGFTFSLSLQRFDSRSDAVVEEANAIGTTYLRSDLLPLAVRSEVQALLREYVDLRVQASTVSLDHQQQRKSLVDKATNKQSQLWQLARKSAELEPNPVTTGLYIQSLNEMIDNFGRRDAALNRHVPEVVLLLLYGTFLLAGTIVGYATGIAGHRPSLVSYLMVLLIVVLVFIILDLDRPRRGLIEVSQKSLLDLQNAVHQPPSAR